MVILRFTIRVLIRIVFIVCFSVASVTTIFSSQEQNQNLHKLLFLRAKLPFQITSNWINNHVEVSKSPPEVSV